jgi:hypothetical protein
MPLAGTRSASQRNWGRLAGRDTDSRRAQSIASPDAVTSFSDDYYETMYLGQH